MGDELFFRQAKIVSSICFSIAAAGVASLALKNQMALFGEVAMRHLLKYQEILGMGGSLKLAWI
jgi:hypothetical protein